MYVSLANPPASEIFYVTESGNIHLVQDLSGLRTTTTYTFQVQARDNRLVNGQNAEARVTIIVRPLQGPPVITPANITIFINQQLNVSFFRISAFDPDLRVSRLSFLVT